MTDDPRGKDSEPDRGRQEALLESAERLAQMGSWEWIPDADELVWSDNLFRIFGLTPGEITPSLGSAFDQVHPDDRQRVEQQAELLRAGRMPPLEYRIVMPTGGVRHLRATVTVVEDEPGRPMRIVGLVQDVTEARMAQRGLAAHAAVANALVEWESLEESSELLLGGIAEAMEVEIGVLWIPEGDVLACRGLWRADSIEGAEFESVTRGLRYPLGVGIPGRTWEERAATSFADPGSIVNRERREAAASAGLRGAVAFPALIGNEVLAVLEFHSREEIELTERLAQALESIGHEIGRFLGRHRAELGTLSLTARELDVLRLAAQGHTRPEIAKSLGIGPATVKTHFEHIFEKLDVPDRAAAVAEALREGLIE
jgi:PAS domain S-box-containing protein